MLTEQQLNTLKNMLLEEKQNLQGTIDAEDGILEHESEKESLELSSYDNHPADLGTELYEREKDMALSVHEEDQLGKVEAALSSMDKGTYGKCEICGKEIPYDRLEAIPYATTCTEHTSERSIPDDRPAEQDYLKPAYDNSFSGRHKEGGIRDYHDSFQEVAKYGTSETPSDFEGDYNSYDELYRDKIKDGFTEEYEMFTGNDMKADDVEVYQTDDEREYEEELDDEGTDTPFGDLPYHQTDGYVDRDKR
ncbi:TraR/DksA C4-type zinc finger protein [Siminovitchia fortis]|uniref:Molecular chaperone DnaK n=1 Tax=Siminovitchia fortis TaxID=254758 RepID=A0A443ILK7_9BACI|nr:TraR/DksA C4-type zinc finger protein [Siminovitchia fortis]RWR05929.1 molecular chaperone DnaK [Siminovitchia fortis]WHY82174.1 TraR/DksA C4-type zinc finger protein [Siminovitchia fortis]